MAHRTPRATAKTEDASKASTAHASPTWPEEDRSGCPSKPSVMSAGEAVPAQPSGGGRPPVEKAGKLLPSRERLTVWAAHHNQKALAACRSRGKPGRAGRRRSHMQAPGAQTKNPSRGSTTPHSASRPEPGGMARAITIDQLSGKIGRLTLDRWSGEKQGNRCAGH